MSENKSEWGTQLIAAAPKRADPSLDPFKQMMSYYRCAAMEVETKFRVLDVQMSLNRENNPIESIKTRLKSPESIFEKLKRRDLPMTLSAIEENLNDIAGVRVICSFPEDIYLLADALLRQDDITLIERKDYIQNPKPNGYRSLHLIVEVPISCATKPKGCAWKSSCARLRWTVGRVWSTSCATKRRFPNLKRILFKKNCLNVRR